MNRMNTDDFWAGFTDFLASGEYDDAENLLFDLLRLAYVSGWKAAGGADPDEETAKKPQLSNVTTIYMKKEEPPVQD